MMPEFRPLKERLRRAALWYAARGLRVHPLRPATKLPMLREWQKQATADPEIVARWWLEEPDANDGIATGACSGTIASDCDPRHGGDESLAELELEYGPMPETWRSHTANGGTHDYFRHPGFAVRNRAALRPGIDLRGDGGYVVAPPSLLNSDR